MNGPAHWIDAACPCGMPAMRPALPFSPRCRNGFSSRQAAHRVLPRWLLRESAPEMTAIPPYPRRRLCIFPYSKNTAGASPASHFSGMFRNTAGNSGAMQHLLFSMASFARRLAHHTQPNHDARSKAATAETSGPRHPARRNV